MKSIVRFFVFIFWCFCKFRIICVWCDKLICCFRGFCIFLVLVDEFFNNLSLSLYWLLYDNGVKVVLVLGGGIGSLLEMMILEKGYLSFWGMILKKFLKLIRENLLGEIVVICVLLFCGRRIWFFFIDLTS